MKIHYPHKVTWFISILFLSFFLKAQKIYNIGVGHLDSTISFNLYIQIYFTSESPYGAALSIPLIFLLNVLIWAHLLSICCIFFARNHSIPKVISVLMSFEISPLIFTSYFSECITIVFIHWVHYNWFGYLCFCSWVALHLSSYSHLCDSSMICVNLLKYFCSLKQYEINFYPLDFSCCVFVLFKSKSVFLSCFHDLQQCCSTSYCYCLITSCENLSPFLIKLPKAGDKTQRLTNAR